MVDDVIKLQERLMQNNDVILKINDMLIELAKENNSLTKEIIMNKRMID